MEKISFVNIENGKEVPVKVFDFEDDTAVCMLGLMLNSGDSIGNQVTIDDKNYRIRGSRANMDTGDIVVKVLPVYGSKN